MHVLLRGDWLQRLRLASGLVLFTFAGAHFLNHGLGLVSLAAMHQVQDARTLITRSLPGTIILAAALITHITLGLYKLAMRKTLKMPLWEAATRRGAVKTVAFDTLPLELDLLRDGYLNSLIGQKYWRWGYDSIQMVYDYIVSGKRYPSFIDTGVDVVDNKNVDAMEQQWKTNDFNTPLPAP